MRRKQHPELHADQKQYPNQTGSMPSEFTSGMKIGKVISMMLT